MLVRNLRQATWIPLHWAFRLRVFIIYLLPHALDDYCGWRVDIFAEFSLLCWSKQNDALASSVSGKALVSHCQRAISFPITIAISKVDLVVTAAEARFSWMAG